ncbi:diacylglycerol kinase [Mesorhizobium sp. LSHC420B00]|nr:diacylglycerol kinase [Mesorhizobium sp. LSHC420B00]
MLAGPKTIASVPDFARADRELVVVRSSMDPEDTLKRFAGRVVFIGGGPPVWDAYARFVSHWDVTRLPYDGPADRWFDARWLTGWRSCQKSPRPMKARLVSIWDYLDHLATQVPDRILCNFTSNTEPTAAQLAIISPNGVTR